MKVYPNVPVGKVVGVINAVDTRNTNIATHTLRVSSVSHLSQIGFEPLVWTNEGRVIGVVGDKAYVVNPNASVLSEDFYVLLGEHKRLAGPELYLDVYSVSFSDPDTGGLVEGYRISITDDFNNKRKKIIDILVSK